MGCFEATRAYPRQNQVICRKVGLSTEKQACLPGFKLIHGESTLSRPKQSHPWQNELICADFTLSTAIQAHPAQSRVVSRKVGSFAAKSTDFGVNKVTLRQTSPSRLREGGSLGACRDDEECGPRHHLCDRPLRERFELRPRLRTDRRARLRSRVPRPQGGGMRDSITKQSGIVCPDSSVALLHSMNLAPLQAARGSQARPVSICQFFSTGRSTRDHTAGGRCTSSSSSSRCLPRHSRPAPRRDRRGRDRSASGTRSPR